MVQINHRAKELLEAAERYCAITGKAPATVATKVMNDGKFFDRIAGGGGITIHTYDKVKDWFRQNTPRTKSKISNDN